LHPILLELGFIKIYTYGLFIATAFLISLSFSANMAKKDGIDSKIVFDLGFYLLLAIIIGSRIMFVFVEREFFLKNPMKIFYIWEGGLVFYGGFIMSLIVAIMYLKKHNINHWQMGDHLAIGIALGHGIGRWGCFFAGCCYGKETDVPWAVVFTDPLSLAPRDVHLHPTQIYDSLNGFTIFFLLLILKRYKKFHGEIFWVYTLLYAIGRFIVENFRGDYRGVLVSESILSTSQWIGLGLCVTSIIMLLRFRTIGIITSISVEEIFGRVRV
jgi:phosphatidylglycerol:prolipoprotein diacylglycerol transferase